MTAGAQHARERHLGEPHVAVLVARRVGEQRVVRVHRRGDALGDHGDAVGAALREALHDRALERAHDVVDRDRRVRELLGDQRDRRARGLARAEREVPRRAPHHHDEEPAVGGLHVEDQPLDRRRCRARARSRSRRWARPRAAAGRCRSSSARARRGSARPPRSATRLDDDAVSSPPIVIRWSIPSAPSDFTTLARCSGFLVGFAREVCRIEPPCRWIRATASTVELDHVARVALHDPREAVEDPDHAVPAPQRARGRGADHAVDAGRGPAADCDAERAHRPPASPRASVASAPRRAPRGAARHGLARAARAQSSSARPRRSCARDRSSRSLIPRSPSTSSVSSRNCACTSVPLAWCRIESGVRLRRVERLDARAARERRLVVGPAAAAHLVAQPREQRRTLAAADPAAAVDEREHDPRARRADARALEQRDDLLGLLERRPVRDRHEDAVGGVVGVLGERLEIALRVEDHEARPRGLLEDPRQRARIARARLEQRHVGRRRHEVHAVLPELRRARQTAFCPGVLEVARRRAAARAARTCGRACPDRRGRRSAPADPRAARACRSRGCVATVVLPTPPLFEDTVMTGPRCAAGDELISAGNVPFG